MFDLEFKINLIIFINIMLIFYILYNKNIEKFAVADDVKAEINKIYQADVDAIRNLSAVASALQSGGLTVPGRLNLPNNTSLSADGDDPTHWLRIVQTKNPAQYKSLAALDLWCQAGTMYSGTISNTGNAAINGTITTGAISTGAITTADWFRVKGGNGLFFQDFGGGWHMTDDQWIRAYNGKSVYCASKTLTEKLQVEQETVLNGATTVTGNATINGNLKVHGKILLGDSGYAIWNEGIFVYIAHTNKGSGAGCIVSMEVNTAGKWLIRRATNQQPY